MKKKTCKKKQTKTKKLCSLLSLSLSLSHTHTQKKKTFYGSPKSAAPSASSSSGSRPILLTASGPSHVFARGPAPGLARNSTARSLPASARSSLASVRSAAS